MNFFQVGSKPLTWNTKPFQSRMVPLSTFFGTTRLSKILIFCLILGFLNRYSPIIFFNTIRILDVISKVKRYIRIFDIISELYCILLKEEAEAQKQALTFVRARYIRTFEEFFMKTSWSYFKNCAFWALGIAPTLDVPVFLQFTSIQLYWSNRWNPLKIWLQIWFRSLHIDYNTFYPNPIIAITWPNFFRRQTRKIIQTRQLRPCPIRGR